LKKKSLSVIALITLVLLLDQSLKVWVKTHMNYGDDIPILGLDWALIHFVENNGMAFGFSFGSGSEGKLLLSTLRIVAVGFLMYYIHFLLRLKASFGLLASFAFILAGALGNIIDSAFYGILFSASPFHGGLATFLPEGGGYAPFLQGKVVDMFYFPIFRGNFPEWIPFLNGRNFVFFRPVFNIADVSITTGVLNILLFQRKFFTQEHHARYTTQDTSNATDDMSPAEDVSPEQS
jgi:signal peptidase II